MALGRGGHSGRAALRSTPGAVHMGVTASHSHLCPPPILWTRDQFSSMHTSKQLASNRCWLNSYCTHLDSCLSPHPRHTHSQHLQNLLCKVSHVWTPTTAWIWTRGAPTSQNSLIGAQTALGHQHPARTDTRWAIPRQSLSSSGK